MAINDQYLLDSVDVFNVFIHAHTAFISLDLHLSQFSRARAAWYGRRNLTNPNPFGFPDSLSRSTLTEWI